MGPLLQMYSYITYIHTRIRYNSAAVGDLETHLEVASLSLEELARQLPVGRLTLSWIYSRILIHVCMYVGIYMTSVPSFHQLF
jgi:hypothetical protein